jgi:SAM-dependent methyltransferase
MRKSKRPKSEQDAFGQEIWAFYNGKDMCEIVERDDGFFSASPNCRTYFSEYKEWSPVEQKAIDLVKGRVLDVGCGAGRHSLYLQQKGYDVVGIDTSPSALKVCKLRGLKKARLMSAENLKFKPGTFDTVIMLGGNFGLLGSPKKAKRILKKLHRMTSKHAAIIGETRDPYKTDNPAHLEYHKENRKKGRLCGQTKIRIRFEKTVGKWFDWMMVSKEEMKTLL